jgi:hypothetical protein
VSGFFLPRGTAHGLPVAHGFAGLEGTQLGFPLVRWVDSRFSSGSAGRQPVFAVIFTVSTTKNVAVYDGDFLSWISEKTS